MSQTPCILIIEPSAKERRREFSQVLLGKGAGPDLQAIKTRLKEIREHSVHEQSSLLEEFERNIQAYEGVSLLTARDAEEAGNYIKDIAGGTKHVVVNRSSVVINELRPGLERLGLNIVEPYFAESASFENRIKDYWDLPNLLEKGLIGNFDISAVATDISLTFDRSTPVKDCVAVLGVNAASAEDGSLFFLQHMSNISKSLEQANRVVLVVGLDKVARDKEEAAFQTKCMGVFGMESMLLNLRPGQAEPTAIDNLPDSNKPAKREVHVILLDNGRSRMLGSPFEDMLLCIGCKACVKQCPINVSMTGDSAVWSPRDYLFTFLLDKECSLDMCLHCEACRVECPVDIDIPWLMWMAQAGRGRSFQERLLGNTELLARVGSWATPISNIVSETEPGKTIIRGILGLDRERPLPRFQRQPFKSWFAREHGQDRDAGHDRRVAYFYGCFTNYYKPDVAKALVNVLERNDFEVIVPDQKCCGIPMIANKNVGGARRNAEYNIRSLAAIAARGYDIVTTCPSCSLMIKREYPSLFDSDEARLVSERLYYAEEYFMLLNRQGKLSRDLGEICESLFIHVPCHLKVQDSGTDSGELVRLIPGVSVANVNTACCGMAGYHGYKKKHSGPSMEIGGKLFEEIGTAQADRVVTSCAACALQIAAGTGATAIHPVLLFQEAYRLGEGR